MTRLVRFLGAASGKPVWVADAYVIAVDGMPGDDTVSIINLMGSTPTSITVKVQGDPDTVAAALNDGGCR